MQFSLKRVLLDKRYGLTGLAIFLQKIASWDCVLHYFPLKCLDADENLLGSYWTHEVL